MEDFFRQRILRSIGIFDENQIEKFREIKIGVAGLGLGGSIFLNLVRMGFEKFHVADPDVFERTNINRQRLAKENNIGRRKDECSIEEARQINPNVQIKHFPEGVKFHNLDEFLSDVDWVVDVVDLFATEDKLALNESARAKGIPVASCATLGFSGSVVIFNSKTPSFAELTGISSSNTYEENLTRFLQFICPEVPNYMMAQLEKAMDRSGYIPFVTPGGEISAAFAAAEISKQIINLGKQVCAPSGIFIDSMNLNVEIFEASHQARKLNRNSKTPKAA